MRAKTFRAFFKRLFGPKYKRVYQSLLGIVILFAALYISGYRLAVASSILRLFASVFTFCMLWQALSSGDNKGDISGILALPINEHEFVVGYTASVSVYTLLSKVAPVMVILFAVGPFSFFEMCITAFAAVHACVICSAWFSWIKERRMSIVVLMVWAAVLLVSMFYISDDRVFAVLLLISLIAGCCVLYFTDPYVFVIIPSGRFHIGRHYSKGSIWIYLSRYLLSHKNYLVNTLFMWLLAIFFPFMLGQVKELNIMPMGFFSSPKPVHRICPVLICKKSSAAICGSSRA